MQPLLTTAGPDVVREVGPDQFHGLDARDPKKVLPPRRSTDRHHAISTSATRDALRRVPLVLAFAAAAAITHRQTSYPVTADASARYLGARWPAS